MSYDVEANFMRLIKAESEVATLTKHIQELKKSLEETNLHQGTSDASHEDILLENAKLKYRLNIIKKAMENTDKTQVTQKQIKKNYMDGKLLYSFQLVLSDIFEDAVKTAFPDVPNAPIPVALSNNPKFGDYQCNSAMPICQILKKQGTNYSPRDIAQKIIESVKGSDLIDKLEIAGPGFINITLSKKECHRCLKLILKHGVLAPDVSEKCRVIVDFSSPNIAKEMHVGHLRSTIIGDGICNFLEYLGHDVVRVNHIGDWGTQFGMLIAHLQDKFPNYLQVSPPVKDLQEFYKESKKRFDDDEEFKKRAYNCVVNLQGHHPDYLKAWNLICDVSRKEFQKVYDRLGIKLTEKGESFYQSRMESLVKNLEGNGFLEEDNGRKIMWGDKSTIPFTIVKSDGGFTYDTSDLATIKYRIEEEKADWVIYVTDSGQATHFDVLQKCAVKCGILDPKKVRFDFVGFGAVLGEDKKKFKTRSGDTVRLVDLLDEGIKRASDTLKLKGRDTVLTPEEFEKAQEAVAYGCIKYADLAHNRIHEYIFSFDKMLDDKGNTAVYLIYALMRIRAISRNAGVTPEELRKAAETTDISLEHEIEWKLAKTLLRFPDVLRNVLGELYLHQLCEFLYEVACTFTDFYGSCYCVERNANGDILKIHMGRLLLCEATASIMEKCFQILGIKTLSKM